MPKIRFIDRTGIERVVDASGDSSVMQAAVTHKVPGIVGECGGCCLCSACHARVDREWIARLERPSSAEEGMLDHIADVHYNSRLTCKIWMTDELDGLVIRTL
jgi:2Fe-2S ferredoxin